MVNNLRKNYKRSKSTRTNTLPAKISSRLLQMPQHGVFLARDWIKYLNINCFHVNVFYSRTRFYHKPGNFCNLAESSLLKTLFLYITGLNNPQDANSIKELKK